MISPARRRETVDHVRRKLGLSERRICCVLKQPRSTQRYIPILSDDEKRTQYDHFGHEGIRSKYTWDDIFRGADFDRIFRDMGFGGFNSIFDMFFGRQTRSRRYGPLKGADLRYDLEITLEDAAFGLNKRIEVPGFETCNACSGSGMKPRTRPQNCPKTLAISI